MKQNHAAYVLCLSMLVAGCAGNTVSIKVAGDIPTPVVEKLELDVGVFYDDQFVNHVYEENSEDRPDWRIESGAAQVALFDEILSSIFARTGKMTEMPAGVAQGNWDLIIAPRVEEMQFSTPTETKTEFYEAWIRYELAIHEPDGSLATKWRIEGYGRSSTALLKDVDKGMNEAINVALRDAGAKMVVKIRDLPEIKSHLGQD